MDRRATAESLEGRLPGSQLPEDDVPWTEVDGRQLVVSRSWGLEAPGAWIGVHTNALPGRPIDGEFSFLCELWEVDGHGELTAQIEHSTSVTRIRGSDAKDVFQAHLPGGAPALYRLSVEVERGAFRTPLCSYLTVPKQRIEAALVPKSRHAHRGGQLRFTLTNRGPTRLYYGMAYELERWTGSKWLNSNVEEAWILPGYSLDPGSTDKRFAARIPDDAPAGRYRITKEVAGEATKLSEQLSFEFEVVALRDRSSWITCWLIFVTI